MLLPEDLETEVLFRGLLIPSFLNEGFPFWWTLLTYALFDSGWLPVLVNSAMILALGSAVARLSSPGTFLALFVLSALGGGVAAYLLVDPETNVYGSSGALAGLVAAAAVMFYRYRDTDPRARMMGVLVAIIVVMNILFALTGGIAWQMRLGGLIAGAIYGYAVISGRPGPKGPRAVN